MLEGIPSSKQEKNNNYIMNFVCSITLSLIIMALLWKRSSQILSCTQKNIHSVRQSCKLFIPLLILGACVRRIVVVRCTCCLSITMLAALYLVYTSKTRFCRVLYGAFKVFTAWVSLKMLCSKVLVSFIGHHSYP